MIPKNRLIWGTGTNLLHRALGHVTSASHDGSFYCAFRFRPRFKITDCDLERRACSFFVDTAAASSHLFDPMRHDVLPAPMVPTPGDSVNIAEYQPSVRYANGE